MHDRRNGGATTDLHAGPDVRLYPLSLADVPELFRLTDRSRQRLRRWLPWVDATTAESDTLGFVQAALDAAESAREAHYGIRLRGALAGVIGFRRPGPHPCGELGYWLGDGFEGLGLMTAACRALTTRLFASGLHRLEIRAAPANRRSRAVAERLGFRLEGLLREAEPLPSGWVDHCVYGMTAGEWTRLRGLRAPSASSPPPGARRDVHTQRDAVDLPDPAHDAAVDAEMAAYYQARAPEYDDWYERRGRYADPDTDALWFAELAQLHQVVRGFTAALPPGASVLDVGCGTGRWTAALAERPDVHVTALDQASAMLEQCHQRLATLGLSATLVRGDALALPLVAEAYAAALSGFVFDHLDSTRRTSYFAELRRVVRPGGRVLILDSRREARHTAEVEIQHRRLRDGSTFRVRKTLFTADTLRDALRPLGPAQAGETGNFFVWAEVHL